MRSIAEPFIRRPVMTVVLTVTSIVFGIVSYLALPVNNLPTVDYPVITVTVAYPGTNAATMAATVATPLEKEFLRIQGLRLVTSSSRLGNSSIILQFELDRNIDAAASDVQAAISRAGATLPPDLPTPPSYEKSDPNSQPIVYIAVTSLTMTLGQLYDFTKNQIAQRISILSGVSKVDIYGQPRAVRINTDPRRLKQAGLTISDVARAVEASSNLLSAGALDGEYSSFILLPKGQLDVAPQYGNIIVGTYNGAPVFLRDVAEAVDGLQTEDTLMNFWARGYDKVGAGLVMGVTRAAGANAVSVAQSIQALIPQMKKDLPPSVNVIPIYDQSKTIQSALFEVKETLVIAFVLVILVIYLFLGRARETLIPAVTIPLSLLLTFTVMRVLNYSIDNLSLLALTLAIGFLVDDAIVFLENMVRRMEDFGESPLEASINGGREIGFTILSMTLSLAAVFIPLVFMGGQIGKIFREFSITIIVSIIMSGVVSLTVTPLMCARLLSGKLGQAKTRMEERAKRLEDWLLERYGSSLHWFLHHRRLSVLVWVGCLIGTIGLMTILPKSFLPPGDSGLVMGIFIAPDDSSPKQMHRYQSQIDTTLRAVEDVMATLTVTNIPAFLGASQGFVLAFLKPEGERPPIDLVANQLRGILFSIPGILPLLRPYPAVEINTGGESSQQGKFSLALSGVDSDRVIPAGQALEQKMRALPGFASVSSDLFLRTRQLSIEFNRDLASTLGITSQAIQEALRDAYSQNYVTLIKAETQQYQVIVNAAPENRQAIPDLTQVHLRTTNNSLVPLSAVASWKEVVGPQSINHINSFPSVTISFDLLPDYPIGRATEAIENVARGVVPPGVNWKFQGEAEAFQETVKSLSFLLIVAVFVMYVILAILYESYVHPLTVLSSLPVATVGGLATLWIFGVEMSLYAFVGLFMLMGIVKKNGIMMIDFAIQREAEGREAYDAVHEACLERFRPIMMTTLAAFMGAVPIALALGAASSSRIPLGLTIMGGLIFSQLVTLYITPVIYLYFDDFQRNVLDRTAFFRRSE